jgi:hypothetical protein
MNLRTDLNKTVKNNTVFRLKMAGIISLKERDFAEFTNRSETDQLYKQLKDLKIVTRRRHDKWGLSGDFLEFDDSIFHNSSSDSDISKIIEENSGLVPIIRKIGIENFKSFFIENQEFDAEAASAALNISIETAKKIVKFIDSISVIQEFFHPSKISEPSISYIKTAKIEISGSKPIFGYYSVNMARGKYLIDTEKLKAFKRSIDKESKGRLDSLISQLNLINNRKNLLHSIIEYLVNFQEQYFLSSDLSKLKFLTAKSLAAALGISESSVSRIIYAKSIVTPWNNEIPLNMLLPKKKNITGYILKSLISQNPEHNDEQHRKTLTEKYNFTVSRRLVCKCRNELKMA